MKSLPHQIFRKCVKVSKDGKTIKCKKGLWSVISDCRYKTEQEAFHYWNQYFSDGEYDSMLEKLSKPIETFRTSQKQPPWPQKTFPLVIAMKDVLNTIEAQRLTHNEYLKIEVSHENGELIARAGIHTKSL